ncbi:MAG: ATP-binding cassette domain-containing protein [Cytophagaceae bacterium]|nr:ATP-binding cassette domain-containing protein [Cytophagaceae bacterium]MDW8455562.1 ATP-binding cassette domain-containing protein [Cytophagaceae bacterium]
MKPNSIFLVHERFIEHYKIKFNYNIFKSNYVLHDTDKEVSLGEFINMLIDTSFNAKLIYVKNFLTKKEILELLKVAHYPILVFQQKGNTLTPIIIEESGKAYTIYEIGDEEITKHIIEDIEEIISHLETARESGKVPDPDKFVVYTCFPNLPLYTEDKSYHEKEEEYSDSKKQIRPVARLLNVLVSERKEILYVYAYSLLASLLGLSMPLGVQSIISFVSSGQIPTSVVVLVALILIGILVTGGLQFMQITMVEHIQQRIFVKTAFSFAYRIPKLKIESVLNYYPPELINRFFDIITLQKGLAKLLIEFTVALLQIIFGLLLLSLYHVSFIFFGLTLIGVLYLVFRFTANKGLKTSLTESKYKYLIANWLEEIAKSLSTFKLAGYSNLPIEKTDYYVSNYIHARKSHFNVLCTQYISFVIFKTLITGGLLILGSILLLKKEINIGQFVATEIVIILVMNSVEKLILQLDTVYDVLTSLEKIGAVMDLPIETSKGINIDNTSFENGIRLEACNVTYKFPHEPEYILKGINLKIDSGEKICITGFSTSGKTTFINILLGFLTSYGGVVTINGLSMRDINKNSYINHVGDNVSQEDLFDDTILNNITIGRNNIPLEDVLWAIELVGLTDFVFSQPNGINTVLMNGKHGISESIARKIIIARSIAKRPKLLVLEDFLLGLEKHQKIVLLNTIIQQKGWTVILVSNDEDVMKMCDRTVLMQEGRIIADGPYEKVKHNEHFAELI